MCACFVSLFEYDIIMSDLKDHYCAIIVLLFPTLDKLIVLYSTWGILDILVPGHFGTGHFATDLDSSGLGWDNIPYWPQLFGTY